ncbi:GNAT family N-acetyltransferase [Novosphingobium sp. PC22D]|uniref:GNAT family N-acetyltransferase n=1 Tax=Novosphingobium sp. PC22D TaxID=1962403 RepID=UPI000BF09EA8|nr:GNAT family N-acetyltransferase [Novosphingobium sp. PC22D]PEQ12163.1 GNAT family N-acetyltransferase [Novosphingobium sp. PC22D]
MLSIAAAAFPDDAEVVLAIWWEFVASSSVSLDFQGNDAEFADLPGKYARPDGGVLLGKAGVDVAGCVALRKVEATICEMKRLYVRPAWRGTGLGRALVGAVIAEARNAGYEEMRLDVMPHSQAARRLYRDFGFGPAAPVTYNPVAGAQFLGLRLI